MPIRKPKFIMREVAETGIKQRLTDGYFDVAAICDAYGKDFNDYLEMRKTEHFLRLLSEEIGIEESELIQPKNKSGEIWIHPQVAINFAQWAKPLLAVMIPKWVFEWMNGEIHEDGEVDIHAFDHIDPEFTAAIKKAIDFDPRKKSSK